MKLPLLLVAIAIAAVLSLCADRATAAYTLIRFNETYATQKGARCLDGSPAAFLGEIGSGAGLTKWVIAMQGGGWCNNEGSCRYRSGTELGSSKNYPASAASLPGMLSSDSAVNPDFYNWNHIYIPYCSGDLHSGTRMDNNSAETWGLYFCGHNNFLAIIDYLASSFRLGLATDIVVTGDSAGAVGSWIHAEGVAARFPSARVVNVPNAGYFTLETLYPAGDLISRVDQLKNQSTVWQSFVPASCGDSKAPENKWTETAVPSLPTPTFWIHAILDTNLMGAQLGFPGFSSSTDNQLTRDWLAELYVSRLAKFQAQIFTRQDDGWWVTSALYHVIGSDQDCQKQGITWLQTAGNWYFNRTGLTRVFDECGVNQSMAIYNSGAYTESTSCPLTKQCGVPPSTPPVAAQSPQSQVAPSGSAAPAAAPMASSPIIATAPSRASYAASLSAFAWSSFHLIVGIAAVCLL